MLKFLNSLPVGSKAHTLLTHMLTTPTLAEDLRRTQAMAIYDSGDLLIGPVEKESLRNVDQLCERIEALTPDDVSRLRQML